MGAVEKEREVDIVAEAAARAIEDAGGDLQEATSRMMIAVEGSDTLRDAIMRPLIRSACHSAVREQLRSERATIWAQSRPRPAPEPAPEEAKRQSDRVVRLAHGTLMMFPLPGGVRLKDASGEQIGRAAEFYSRQASDMSSKARWLRLVAQAVPEGSVAGDVLDDSRLAALREEADNG